MKSIISKPIFLIIIILTVSSTILSSPISNPSFQQKCDSILFLKATKTVTYVHVTNNKPIYVFAVACKTLPYSIDKIENILKRIDNYTFMSIITKIKRIDQKDPMPQKDVYFLEASGNFIAKAWYLGTFNDTASDKITDYTVSLNHYSDSVLDKQCHNDVKALIKIDFRDFLIKWRLKEISPDSTNVELVSYLSLNMWIPKWLFDLTAKMLYPGVLEDLEKVLYKSGSNQNR
jgi:hypothetical protein